MATTVKRLLSGLRRGVQDELRKSGSYEVGDILEFTTDAIDIASIAAGAEDVQSIADCTGVAIGDVVLGVAPLGAAADPIYDGGLLLSAKVITTDTIRMTWANVTAGALDPTSQRFRIVVLKAAT